MIMTLQAGEKLMSLTDVSEMLGIPVHTFVPLAAQRRRASWLSGGPARAVSQGGRRGLARAAGRQA